MIKFVTIRENVLFFFSYKKYILGIFIEIMQEKNSMSQETDISSFLPSWQEKPALHLE